MDIVHVQFELSLLFGEDVGEGRASVDTARKRILQTRENTWQEFKIPQKVFLGTVRVWRRVCHEMNMQVNRKEREGNAAFPQNSMPFAIVLHANSYLCQPPY